MPAEWQVYKISSSPFFIFLWDACDPDFLPGGAKYLDLPGFLLLDTSSSLWLQGETIKETETLSRHYAEAGEKQNLRIVSGTEPKANPLSAVDWMLR